MKMGAEINGGKKVMLGPHPRDFDFIGIGLRPKWQGLSDLSMWF